MDGQTENRRLTDRGKVTAETDSTDGILSAIHVVRGLRVMLDSGLADLYGVPVKALNQAVKRNMSRFPEDFMFQLTSEETGVLRSQIVTLDEGRGRHRKYLPYAFTEQGVAMLSSVLNSERAVRVNIHIMRAFVRARELAATHSRLAQELEKLKGRVDLHDSAINAVMDVLSGLLSPPAKKRARIGFRP